MIESIEKYIFQPDGSIEVNVNISPHGEMPEMLPRAGLQFQIPKKLRNVEWYGRGPFETYPDRKTGAKIGIHNSDIDLEYVPYVIPQDYGNHADVRWIKLENEEGRGLLIKSNDHFNFSYQKYATENLSRAMYTYQLKEAPYNTLNIDFEVSGVGGPAVRQLQKSRVHARDLEFDMVIEPY